MTDSGRWVLTARAGGELRRFTAAELPVLIGAFIASLVLTYFPARQAARTTIAEALRYE